MTTTKKAQTSYRHIWRLSWPVMISNISLPLVGAVDVAMMGHLPDPAFIGGVALGGLVFNFLSGLWLPMGTTGLTALAAGAGQMDEVASVFLRGQLVAAVGGFWADYLSAGPALGNRADRLKRWAIWNLSPGGSGACPPRKDAGMMRLCMVQLLLNLLNIVLFIFVLGLSWQVEVALASVCAEWAGCRRLWSDYLS